jgi:hypothetical protein
MNIRKIAIAPAPIKSGERAWVANVKAKNAVQASISELPVVSMATTAAAG